MRYGSSRTACSTKTTMFFSKMSHLTIWMKGGMTVASRTFLMTSTVSGGLYQVRRCEAGSWMVLSKEKYHVENQLVLIHT